MSKFVKTMMHHDNNQRITKLWAHFHYKITLRESLRRKSFSHTNAIEYNISFFMPLNKTILPREENFLVDRAPSYFQIFFIVKYAS